MTHAGIGAQPTLIIPTLTPVPTQMTPSHLTPATGTPPGFSSEIIQVKFREGTDVDPPEEALSPNLRDSVANIRRLVTLSDQELERIGGGTFKLWFEITLKPGTDAAAFLNDLKQLPSVEIAQPAPLPPPPP